MDQRAPFEPRQPPEETQKRWANTHDLFTGSNLSKRRFAPYLNMVKPGLADKYISMPDLVLLCLLLLGKYPITVKSLSIGQMPEEDQSFE